MITEDTALIDHEKDRVELPRGINQLYTTQEKWGNAFHIQLPTTGKDQYWCIVRADTERQTIDYKSSRLSIRVDKLREIMKLAAKENNTVYTPVSSHKQSGQFGIYVSPKMTTHAFVGPFKATQCTGGEAPATPDLEIPELPDSKITQVTKTPQTDRALRRETPQEGKPKIHQVAGCSPVLGYTTLPRGRALGKPPSKDKLHEHVTDAWPHHANKSGTHSNRHVKSAAAGRRAIDRQRRKPNRPPEPQENLQTNRRARNQPVSGGARRQ